MLVAALFERPDRLPIWNERFATIVRAAISVLPSDKPDCAPTIVRFWVGSLPMAMTGDSVPHECVLFDAPAGIARELKGALRGLREPVQVRDGVRFIARLPLGGVLRGGRLRLLLGFEGEANAGWWSELLGVPTTCAVDEAEGDFSLVTAHAALRCHRHADQ